MLDSSGYREQHQEFVRAYGKLRDDGYPHHEAVIILADALKEAREDEGILKKLCNEIAEQGKNHPLAKSADFGLR